MEKKILSDEPEGNWKSVEYYRPANSTGDFTDASMGSRDSLMGSFQPSALANSLRDLVFSINDDVLKSLVRVSQRPSELNTLNDVHVNDYKNEISCFLYVKRKVTSQFDGVMSYCARFKISTLSFHAF